MPVEDDVSTVEESNSEQGVNTADGGLKGDAVSAGELYDVILRHPDFRVVEASDHGRDYCHPLTYWFDQSNLMFIYDGASRPFARGAECETIIAVSGDEPLDESRKDGGIYILQDLFADKWDWDGAVAGVEKISLDSSAKWIKLHPAESDLVRAKRQAERFPVVTDGDGDGDVEEGEGND